MRARRRLAVILAAVALLVAALATPAVAEQVAADVDGVREGPVLGPGARGDEVAEWQRALNEWLVRHPQGRRAVAVDGVFGPQTAATTRRFQSWAGIDVDGVVGPGARRAMHSVLDDGPVRAREVLPSSADTAQDFGRSTPPPVTVTDVRVTAHGEYDRVTFTVRGEGRPGWDAGYLRGVDAREAGVRGDAVLEVTLRNVDGVDARADHDMQPRPHRRASVLEVTREDADAGTVTYRVGVAERQPFEVRRFDSPQRVVVDVAR